MNSSTKVAIHRSVKFAIFCIAAVSIFTQRNNRSTADAFVPQPLLITPKQTLTSPTTFFPNQHNNHHQIQSRHPYIMIPIMATTTSSDEELHNEINSMKAKDIRQELQSYGIPTKAFFEKSELVDALITARKEGKTAVKEEDASSAASSTTTNASSETTASASSSGDNTNNTSASRQERLNQEMEKCKSMKVGELKKELESYGVSTKSFFEKSEFVKAVAENRVDGVKQTSTGGGSSSSSSRVNEEPRDPSFRDVTVSKFKDKALLGRGVIDVKAR